MKGDQITTHIYKDWLRKLKFIRLDLLIPHGCKAGRLSGSYIPAINAMKAHKIRMATTAVLKTCSQLLVPAICISVSQFGLEGSDGRSSTVHINSEFVFLISVL